MFVTSINFIIATDLLDMITSTLPLWTLSIICTLVIVA